MAKGFRDYAEVNEEQLEGFTVAKAGTGINAEDSGMMIELERVIDNVTIGIDIIYDFTNKEGEAFRVSEKYVKHIRQ
ncbi:MAG: hypothetical protein K2K74_13850 [Lachnospiraceae bacterium]|nr:hypothetical protein [Lachnospiraceae bacterium]